MIALKWPDGWKIYSHDEPGITFVYESWAMLGYQFQTLGM